MWKSMQMDKIRSNSNILTGFFFILSHFILLFFNWVTFLVSLFHLLMCDIFVLLVLLICFVFDQNLSCL